MRRFAALTVVAVLALTGCSATTAAEPSPMPSASATYSTKGASSAIRDASDIDGAVSAVLALDPEKLGAASSVMEAMSAFETALEKHLSSSKGDPFRVQLIKAIGEVDNDMTVEGARRGVLTLQDIAKQVRESH